MGTPAQRNLTEDSTNIGQTEMSENGIKGKKDKNFESLDRNKSNFVSKNELAK